MNRAFPGFVAFPDCLAVRQTAAFEVASVKLRPAGQPDYRCRSVTIRIEIDDGGNESFGSHRVGVGRETVGDRRMAGVGRKRHSQRKLTACAARRRGRSPWHPGKYTPDER